MAKIFNAFQSNGGPANIPMPEKENEDQIDPKITNMKRKVELLHKGFVVHVKDIIDSDEDSNFLVLKVTLNSSVNYSPVFGDVEIKIAKQAVHRLKNELGKVM